MRAVEQFSAQAVNEIVASGMEDVRVRRFRQSRRKSGLKGFYYRKCFVRWDGGVSFFEETGADG